MEIVKANIQMNKLGKPVMDQFMIDEDYNVSDSKADIGRIISGEGKIKIEETKKLENYIRISGKLQFKMLYVTDSSEPVLSSLEGRIPFEEMVYIEDVKMEGDYIVQVSRVDFSASLIHSRKVAIKSIVDLIVHSECTKEEQAAIDMEGEIFKKKKELNVLELNSSKKDIYRIREEIEIAGTKENIGTMIWHDISLRKMDTKLTQDALELKGELMVFCFYESQEGKMDWVEQAVSFEGRVECPGADESCYHHVYHQLADANVEVRMDADGEMRLIGIEGILELRILIYEEKQMEFLEDAYSLKEQCILEKERASYEELILQNHSKCKINEHLQLPEVRDEILQICHSGGSMQVEHMEMTESGIQIEGILHVNFLYVKENDRVPFDMWQGMIPFSYLLECPSSKGKNMFDITYNLEQIVVDLSGNGEVEIKAVLAFQSFIRSSVELDNIKDCKMEKFDKEMLEKRPGIVGYVVKKGDELWDLAKQNYTTEASIMMVNNLSSSELKEGQKILIFRENTSIL